MDGRRIQFSLKTDSSPAGPREAPQGAAEEQAPAPSRLRSRPSWSGSTSANSAATRFGESRTCGRRVRGSTRGAREFGLDAGLRHRQIFRRSGGDPASGITSACVGREPGEVNARELVESLTALPGVRPISTETRGIGVSAILNGIERSSVRLRCREGRRPNRRGRAASFHTPHLRQARAQPALGGQSGPEPILGFSTRERKATIERPCHQRHV